jgi:hypothetical protein
MCLLVLSTLNRPERTVRKHQGYKNRRIASVTQDGEELTIINFALEKFKDRLPDFVRLCEEKIYQSGAWPKTIPYRWDH